MVFIPLMNHIDSMRRSRFRQGHPVAPPGTHWTLVAPQCTVSAVSTYPSSAADLGARRRIPLAGLAALLCLLADARAAEPSRALRDGQLLSREPCPASGSSYADYRARVADQWRLDDTGARAQGLRIRPLADFLAALPTETEYAERKAYAGFECERLTYASDGLRVVAYYWRPSKPGPDSGRLPLILFNRGGYGEEFKLRPNTWFGFFNYLKAGYAVLGSQYRGNDGGEGQDELGGADLHDVQNLVPLSRELGFPADARRYALGFSRGGLMTLLAMRDGLPVRAAAVMGTPVDLTSALNDARSRASMAQRIPRFEDDPVGALRERSPILHVPAVRQPLLILQGTGDALVSPRSATRLADALLEQRAPVSLVLYEGDTHGLALNGADRDRRIIEWFRQH